VRARAAGKQLDRLMGTHPGLSLDDARKRARSWAAMIAEGKDPSEERRARVEAREAEKSRIGYTFGVAYEEFLGMRAPDQEPGAKKDESHRDREKVAAMLKGSKFWRTSMHTIDVADVDSLMKPLKTLADGGPRPHGWGPKTGRSWSTVLKIWRHAQHAYRVMAQNRKIIASRDASPFALWLDAHPGFFPQQQPKDTHLNTTTTEGRAWLMALWGLHAPTHEPAVVGGKVNTKPGTIKPHHGVFVDYVLCLLLWGTRRAETASLRWTDVRFDEGVIILRPEETKARRAHGVPLTPWAVEILQARQRDNALWRPDDPSPFVFPSRVRGKHIDGVPGLVTQLGEETGTRITAHDLRRTLATDMAMFTGEAERLGKILEIGVMLDHSKANLGRLTPTTIGYIRRMSDALRPLYQRRETYLRGLCGLPSMAAVVQGADLDGSEALRAAIKADPVRAARMLAEVMGGA